MEDYLEIELGSSFLINAGICGLLKFLKYSDANLGIDYKVEEQALYLSKDYIRNNDFAKLYIKAMIKHFRKDTKYYDVLQEREIVERIYEKNDITDEDKNKIKEIYKRFVEMLGKSSFKSGYEILKSKKDIKPITSDMVNDLKKEKDDKKKRDLYLNLCEVLAQEEVENVLIMKDIIFSKINMFMNGISFLDKKKQKKDIAECYRQDFVNPLLEEINSSKQKKKRCIECSKNAIDTRAISFISDTTDDTARKKSHYWNLKPDAFVCPICAFLYTLIPLGFQFCGSDAIFINNNSSIKVMSNLMDTYQEKIRDAEGTSRKSKLYRIFTTEGLELIENKLENIQVIARIKTESKEYYQINIISKDLLEGFKAGKQQLQRLEKKFIPMRKESFSGYYVNNGYLSIYDSVMKDILFRKNLYPLINHLLVLGLKDNSNINYLKDILKLQFIFKGGKDMVSLLKENSDKAWQCGREMREILTKDIQEKDMDNSLRGVVYKLNNCLSVKNREQFLDTIIRIYSGKGVSIPWIFKECYQSDEMLQAIGYGYILGLKYKKYEKGNEEESLNN